MRKWAWLGQWTAALMGAAGVGVELAFHADVYFILISAGCLTFAIFTKLRHEA